MDTSNWQAEQRAIEEARRAREAAERVPPVTVPQYQMRPGTNGLAIASFVLGLIWIVWLGSILAVIFGHIALRQIRRSGEEGRGFAIAGVVLGWIGVATLILSVILAVAAVNEANDEPEGFEASVEPFEDDFDVPAAETGSYGSDPDLDLFYDECAAGDLAACDTLAFESPIGSEYEQFGTDCGGYVDLGVDAGTCQEAAEQEESGDDSYAGDAGAVGAAPDLSEIPVPSPGEIDPHEATHLVTVAGFGSDAADTGDTITFQFAGRLADGTVFVNSWETSGPVTFTLGDGELVSGFDEALRGLVSGDRAEIYVGSEAAYGAEGNRDGSVPPGSDLAYVVEVIAVNGV